MAAATASTATVPWFNGGRMKCDAIAVTTMTSARGGEQAPGPAAPERPQPQPAGGDQLAEDQPGDEVARQDEEHVDADEAAVDPEQAGVEEDDGDDGEGAQALDVRSEALIEVRAERTADGAAGIGPRRTVRPPAAAPRCPDGCQTSRQRSSRGRYCDRDVATGTAIRRARRRRRAGASSSESKVATAATLARTWSADVAPNSTRRQVRVAEGVGEGEVGRRHAPVGGQRGERHGDLLAARRRPARCRRPTGRRRPTAYLPVSVPPAST